MPHDPHAQIDQTVLEMIEHSPVGAVPHTPSYQDALKRLVASHQVYVSADHKGGHVTVRSLAGLPLFHAQNLESFLSGKVNADALESDASIFSRYVQSLPEALRAKAEAARAVVVARRAHHRAKHGVEVVQEPVHSLFLVPGGGSNPGLPGNYLYGSILQASPEAGSGWTLHVHDSLDGAAMCDLPTQSEALEKLQEVLASAPFLLSELDALGFRFN
ncbi:MAG TPA: hypothetical protein VL357_03640 [Rariglobus sp.]|jgi:hypothetical protein|nr:hypothetical protein [Rariglobus sp.]